MVVQLKLPSTQFVVLWPFVTVFSGHLLDMHMKHISYYSLCTSSGREGGREGGRERERVSLDTKATPIKFSGPALKNSWMKPCNIFTSCSLL